MSITRGKNGVPDEFYQSLGCTQALEYSLAPFDYAQISKSVERLNGPVTIYQSSCHNCGAPYEPAKCSYCGTHQ